MVRKKFDRTVVKRCPQCEEHVPVACKFCTCGHPFATRNKILLKEEAEEAMGLLDGSASDTKGDDNSSSESRRRPRRLTRERPNYYVITTELNRHVKKKARQRERNRAGPSGPDNDNTPKKKKRGRPRGSGSSTSGTRTRSKTKKLSDHYPSSQPSHGLQIKKEELGFTDTKNSISSSLSYGCDKPLANVTVSICAAPNRCCTPNLSNCNVTKHHIGIQGNSSNYSSSSDGANSNSGSHGKDITISSNNQNSSTNGHLNSNTMTNNTINIRNQVSSELNSHALNNNNTSSNNSIYNNNNNSNNQKDPGGEKDMYSSMSFEKAMKFYAILADLNRKIISQSFKPL